MSKEFGPGQVKKVAREMGQYAKKLKGYLGFASSEREREEIRLLQRAAEDVSRDLTSKSFTPETVREAFSGKASDRPQDEQLPGERLVSLTLDAISYEKLDWSDPKALTSQAVTEATRNSSARIKMAVSAGKYALGVGPIKLFNDTTKLLGDAVRNRNAEILKANMAVLRRWTGTEARSAEPPESVSVMPPLDVLPPMTPEPECTFISAVDTLPFWGEQTADEEFDITGRGLDL